MADLIEYRFGQAGHGRGWYDGKSIVEFRTPPIDGMINAIEKYNKILWGIKTASQRFGLIPVLTGGAVEPHLHFSFKVREESSQKNLTGFDDDDSQNFMLKALQGYFELLEKSPALITNDLPDELVRNTQLKALPSRASSLRICEDTMEVRMDISHLARNMALLIAGCSVYAFGKDNLIESKENDGLSMADYIVIPDALKARFTSISSTLESCRLDEDGYLVPDESTVSWNMKGMNVEAGVTPKDVTAPSVDGHGQYTLADWEGWYLSLKKLKYKDGQVEVSELPKELQPIFSKLNGLSTVRRPYFRKLNNETNILADKLDDQADQAILKRAFGEAHGSSVIGFYKQADSDNRIRKAGAVVNSVLMDADDLDKPNSDIAEKIYDVLFKSIADCLDKTNGKSGIPDIRTLHTLTQRRLSDLSLEAELTAASGITSNAQIDALGDLTDEAKKPFEDVSRFSKVIASNVFDLFEEEIRQGVSGLSNILLPYMIETFMMVDHVYTLMNVGEERQRILHSMDVTLENELNALDDKVKPENIEFWNFCKAAVKGSVERIKGGPADNGDLPIPEFSKHGIKVAL